MEKPLDIKIFETREILRKCIANSELNVSIVCMILKELYSDISVLADQNLTKSMSDYNKWLSTQEEVTDNGEHKQVSE